MHADVRLISHIDRNLRRACQYIDAIDRRTLRALTPPLTPAQYHVLVASTTAHSTGDIAQLLDCDPSNATGLIDRMAKLGLLQKERNPLDGRRVIVTLTAAGHATLVTATQARLAALADPLHADAMSQLVPLNRHIRWLLNQLAEAAG